MMMGRLYAILLVKKEVSNLLSSWRKGLYVDQQKNSYRFLFMDFNGFKK